MAAQSAPFRQFAEGGGRSCSGCRWMLSCATALLVDGVRLLLDDCCSRIYAVQAIHSDSRLSVGCRRRFSMNRWLPLLGSLGFQVDDTSRSSPSPAHLSACPRELQTNKVTRLWDLQEAPRVSRKTGESLFNSTPGDDKCCLT